MSSEDELDGDSGSILNQRDFLLKYCNDHHFVNIRFFCDDGYTGTNFDRPAFQEMMELVEQDKISTIIVKDHSRLGRNRLKVGFLMERFTDDYDIRYIAVTDGIDSNKGLDDMVAVRELFNEFYPRDTSKKIRAIFTSKGNNGERLCTRVPYGYVGNKYGWEIDPDAANVVKKIFSLCMDGRGPRQIAKQLQAEKVLNPTTYKFRKGISIAHKVPENPYNWDSSCVIAILERLEYTGCTVNFKGYKKSYKSKKRIQNNPEQWKVFPDTHPAIIDMETWKRVQELRKNRRRTTKTGKQGLFSGLVFCADCGSKLYFNTCASNTYNQDSYACSKYKSSRGGCSIHFIREAVLYRLVLEHIQQTLYFVRTYENDFVRSLMDKSATEQKKALAQKRQELAKAEKRIAELDLLFQRVYEDNISGKLTDERFSKLSTSYENEQRTLTERMTVLQAELNQEQEQVVNVEQFITLAKKYADIQELTPTIVNEFISKIIVHAPDKSSGHRTQQVDIEYNFVGNISVSLAKLKTA